MTGDEPTTAREHLAIHVDLASYLLVDRLRRGDEPAPALRTHPGLVAGFERTVARLPDTIDWEDVPDWYEKFMLDVERRDGREHFPLEAVAQAGGLSMAARLGLVLAGSLEDLSALGPAFAELQPPLVSPRPTLATLASVGGRFGAGASVAELERTLVATSLVEVLNHDDPRPDWLVRVPLPIWKAVSGGDPGEPSFHHRRADDSPRLDELPIPSEDRGRLARVADALADGELRALVIRGGRGTCRNDVAAAVARSFDHGTVRIDVTGSGTDMRRRLGGVAAASRAIPVLELDLAPGERSTIERLDCWSGPVIVVAGTAGGIDGPVVERAVTIQVPFEGRTERREIWTSVMPGASDDDLDALSERFLLPSRHLRRVAGEAAANAVLDGGRVPTFDDVVAAGSVLDRSSLDTRALRLEARPDAELVTSSATTDRLHHLQRRCRHREVLAEEAGTAFRGEVMRGVKALFTGRSGTGKTLAARILAAELGMELYRIDLATTINKYVGETEKNLHEVFTAAEEHDVVLLIDEGDALLSSRTDVRSANDRYANLETDYLLQRLETHHGVTIVTTNLTENIDQAFQRRMDVVVEFPEPSPVERLELWRLHLPGDHRVGGAELETIAERCALTGGQIRNAALFATLLAVDGDATVDALHVNEALASEYAKAGAASPLGPTGARHDRTRGVHAFIGGLR